MRVYTSSRADELAQTGWTEEQKQAFIEMQFHAQWQDYSNRFPDAEQSIVLHGETPAGRIWINRSNEEIRLLDITLLPEFRNSGTGTLLLQKLQDEARISSKKLHHAVYKDNIDALRFYERLGFSIVEDYETYCIMEWISTTR
jgi:ribosomal protein S18 acetylase RimI-like enzyme